MLAVFLAALTCSPVVVSGGAPIDYQPSPLQDEDGRLLVAFERLTPPSQGFLGDIWMTFSSDTGSTWSAPVPAVTGSANQRHPALVHVPAGGYRLFYLSDQNGPYRIFSAYSPDGSVWTEEGEVNLGWTASEDIGNPTVSAEGDSALVMSYDRFFGLGGYSARSTDGGVTWDTDMTRINQKGRLNRLIRHSDGTYLCSWQETGGGTIVNIFASYSADLSSWAPSESLTTNNNGHDSMPFEDEDGNAWIFYSKHSGTVYEVMRRSVPVWGTYGIEELIYSGVHNATQPHPLLLGDGRTALFWGEWWNNYDESDVMMDILDPTGIGTLPESRGDRFIELSPNPFSGNLRLSLDLPGDGPLQMEVFDLSGRLVCSSLLPAATAGPQELYWEPGPDSPPGTYVVRVAWPGAAASRMCVLLP